MTVNILFCNIFVYLSFLICYPTYLAVLFDFLVYREFFSAFSLLNSLAGESCSGHFLAVVNNHDVRLTHALPNLAHALRQQARYLSSFSRPPFSGTLSLKEISSFVRHEQQLLTILLLWPLWCTACSETTGNFYLHTIYSRYLWPAEVKSPQVVTRRARVMTTPESTTTQAGLATSATTISTPTRNVSFSAAAKPQVSPSKTTVAPETPSLRFRSTPDRLRLRFAIG